MRLLLDSHTLLWSFWNSSRLGTQARDAIRSPDNEAFVSVASIGELAMKRASGRLNAPADLIDACRKQGFALISIQPLHAEHAASLPMHHRDSFDRMLIAQAQAEELVIVTADAQMRRYGVRTMAANE